MADGTDDYDEFDTGLDGIGDPGTERDRRGPAELPLGPGAHHRRRAGGRHRPRGDRPGGRRAPELPHWNDAPTGQVPAVLDRSTGEELRRAAHVARGGHRLGGPGGDLRALHALRRPAGRRGAPRRAARGGRRRAPALALRVRRHAGHPARAGPRARPRCPSRCTSPSPVPASPSPSRACRSRPRSSPSTSRRRSAPPVGVPGDGGGLGRRGVAARPAPAARAQGARHRARRAPARQRRAPAT